MNIQFQRKVDRYIGTFICRIFSLFHHIRGDRRTSVKAKSILVILLSEMGSLVLAYPMFQQLKTQYPAANLYGLLFEKNKEILSLLDVTAEEKIITIRDTSFLGFVIDCFRAFFQIRKMKIDIVIAGRFVSWQFYQSARIVQPLSTYVQTVSHTGGGHRFR
jgi:hypothetical protein